MNGIYRNNFSLWIEVENGIITAINDFGNLFHGYKLADDSPCVGMEVTAEYLNSYGFVRKA